MIPGLGDVSRIREVQLTYLVEVYRIPENSWVCFLSEILTADRNGAQAGGKAQAMAPACLRPSNLRRMGIALRRWHGGPPIVVPKTFKSWLGPQWVTWKNKPTLLVAVLLLPPGTQSIFQDFSRKQISMTTNER